LGEKKGAKKIPTASKENLQNTPLEPYQKKSIEEARWEGSSSQKGDIPSKEGKGAGGQDDCKKIKRDNNGEKGRRALRKEGLKGLVKIQTVGKGSKKKGKNSSKRHPQKSRVGG